MNHDPDLREVLVQPPALPPGLAARLSSSTWHRNLVGEAGAAVYRVQRARQDDRYLKLGRGDAAQALVDEMTRLRWLAGRWSVPVLEHFDAAGDEAWLLTRAVPGRTAYEWLQDAPQRTPLIVNALARSLAGLHALSVDTCPFDAGHALRLADARRRLDAGQIDADDFDAARQGWSAEQLWQEMQRLLPTDFDPVVTHGDYSLDNILLDADGRVTGVIDVGRAGVADRYQDLAILWNCLAEFGTEAQTTLFKAYGIARPDIRKLDFHLCLDECF